MKKKANDTLWKVTVGQNYWNVMVFVFSTAEDASVFCENAALNYSKELSDSNSASIPVKMEAISTAEYSDIVAEYERKNAPQENAEA